MTALSAPSSSTLLGDLVAARPAAARVLQAHGLDYCCGGRRPLNEACAQQGVDPAVVLLELSELPNAPVELDHQALSSAELCDHIVAVHHDYLWREMPRLSELANKVARVHGASHPELRDVQRTWQALVTDLTDHLLTEEQQEFPAIKRFEHDEADFTPAGVEQLMREHDVAGDLLVRLRELTSDYAVPADGCASYRALYQGLAELEGDLHTHIHKENNILFPRLLD